MPPKIQIQKTLGVIYARYSSHNQKEESIEQQVDECMAFALSNNIEIVHVYADKAISGRTDKRTQFQHMMRDAEKRQFAVVIAYKSNRIARNMLQALTYEAKLDNFGIKTLYAKEEFGNSAAGRFALRTMMNVNQFYSENMAEDIRRGMADNAANCKVNGALPLGYVKGKDGKYEINEKEAVIVKEIFDSVLKDVSFIDLQNSFNMRGIKTKYGNAWNKNSFHRILKNVCYIGTYHFGNIVIENGIPPIVTKEVFYAVQEKLKVKKNPHGRHREAGDYLLTGKLHCGHCNSFMVGISGTGRSQKHYYYTCQTRRLEKTCNKENVRRDWIEKLIAEYTQKFILQDDVIEWIANSAIEFQKQANKHSDLSSLENDLAENKKSIKNIMTAIEQGIFTSSTRDRLLELELEVKSLEQSISAIKAVSKPLEKDRIIWALEKFRSGDISNKSYQAKLIDTFVKAVYLWDDKIRIDYYYAGEKNSITHSLSLDPGSADALTSVRTSPPELHHTRLIRTKQKDVVIYATTDGFVLMSPIFKKR